MMSPWRGGSLLAGNSGICRRRQQAKLAHVLF
jgi:hypothetical protein